MISQNLFKLCGHNMSFFSTNSHKLVTISSPFLSATSSKRSKFSKNNQNFIRNLSNCCRSFSNNDIKTAMRFIQFRRKNETANRLGIVSEAGTNYLDLTAQTNKYPSDMIEFIKCQPSLDELEKEIQCLKWACVEDDIQLLPPVINPEKIICIGLNYLGHCLEQNKEPPKEPMFFSKFASALTGPTGNVIHHNITSALDWEVELAVIIGKEAKCVRKENAMDYVFGYSVAQDISARDWQKFKNGGQFLIGKTMDSFCPLGPSIVHKSLITDPHALTITCSINGVQKQCGNTSELIYRIDDIISRLTESITLKPGDVILTGTPSGVGMHRKPPEYLKPGDIIDSEIQYIGKLHNTVV